MKGATETLQSRYDRYLIHRASNTPALKAYQTMTRLPSDSPLIDGLISTMIGLIVFSVVQRIVDKLTGGHHAVPATVWIESPSGDTKREFPFWQGSRIVRKHDWHFAVVAPIRPARIVSRREALGILLWGDRLD